MLRQPQQTPKPAPQATPAPETANPSARGANTHPLQLPPNCPALAQDPTQEPSPTPTATPVTGQAGYLYDGDGLITTAQSFDPFGSALGQTSMGGGYGYAGEWADASGF